jgi:beta-exotoxin I transport system permease protein
VRARWAELVLGPFRASWRSGLAWAAMFVLIVVSTVAFWPAFKGSTAIEDAFKLLPPALVQAFGLQDFASAAGYLRGGLYEVLVPLMFVAAAVLLVSTSVAADEDAGRIELFVTQPVTRRALFAGRALAVLLWLIALVAVVLGSQLVSDVLFDLEIPTDRIVATVALCGLLGAWHGGLALAVAGLAARPALVAGIGLGVALVGYLVAALFRLSDALAPLASISPWDWALGGEPLVRVTEPWRVAVLLVPAVVLAAVGLLAFERRDIRSA